MKLREISNIVGTSANLKLMTRNPPIMDKDPITKRFLLILLDYLRLCTFALTRRRCDSWLEESPVIVLVDEKILLNKKIDFISRYFNTQQNFNGNISLNI